MGHFSVEIMRLPGQLSVEINSLVPFNLSCISYLPGQAKSRHSLSTEPANLRPQTPVTAILYHK